MVLAGLLINGGLKSYPSQDHIGVVGRTDTSLFLPLLPLTEAGEKAILAPMLSR